MITSEAAIKSLTSTKYIYLKTQNAHEYYFCVFVSLFFFVENADIGTYFYKLVSVFEMTKY